LFVLSHLKSQRSLVTLYPFLSGVGSMWDRVVGELYAIERRPYSSGTRRVRNPHFCVGTDRCLSSCVSDNVFYKIL